MALGQNTYWLLVAKAEGSGYEAVTPVKDKRRALQFYSYEAARQYKEVYEPSYGNWKIVKVPA